MVRRSILVERREEEERRREGFCNVIIFVERQFLFDGLNRIVDSGGSGYNFIFVG